MAELLELADDQTRAMWERPEPRVHGIDRPPAAPARDRHAVRLDRGGRRARVRGRRGGDLLPPVDVAPGRQPRHRHVARVPVAVRDRAQLRGDGEPARAHRGGRLVARCRSPHSVVPAGDPHGRGQRAAQPDGHAADGGGVAPSRLRMCRRGHSTCRRRGLPLPRAGRRRDAARRGRPRRAGGLDRRDVEVVRDGRAADRVARDAGSGGARSMRADEGLHDDLLVGAVGGARAHRPASPGAPCWREAARSSRPTSRSSTTSSRAAPMHSRWVRPRGGSTGFPRLVADGPAGSSADAFAARLVEATGVLLLPSTTFGSGDSHFRIGLGRKDLPEAISALSQYLDRSSGSSGGSPSP